MLPAARSARHTPPTRFPPTGPAASCSFRVRGGRHEFETPLVIGHTQIWPIRQGVADGHVGLPGDVVKDEPLGWYNAPPAAPRRCDGRLCEDVHVVLLLHSRVTNSSRFSNTRASAVHAAASAASAPAGRSGPASLAAFSASARHSARRSSYSFASRSALRRRRLPCQTQPEAVTQPRLRAALRLRHDPPAQRAVALHEYRVVEQRQRLQRRVGAVAADAAAGWRRGRRTSSASGTGWCAGTRCTCRGGSGRGRRFPPSGRCRHRSIPRCRPAAAGARSGRRRSRTSRPLDASASSRRISASSRIRVWRASSSFSGSRWARSGRACDDCR